MAQTLGDLVQGLPLVGGAVTCSQGTDAETLGGQVRLAMITLYTAHPTAMLIDIGLSFAGDACMATVFTGLGDGETPDEELLNALTFKWFQAADRHSLAQQMTAYIATLANNRSLYAWDLAGNGAGNSWFAVIVHWNSQDGG